MFGAADTPPPMFRRFNNSISFDIRQSVYPPNDATLHAAQKANIKVIWRDLPEGSQRENYKQVATYPRTFLDKHFGNDVEYTLIDDATINMIYNRLTALEDKFDQLITKLDHVNTDDDELPF